MRHSVLVPAGRRDSNREDDHQGGGVNREGVAAWGWGPTPCGRCLRFAAVCLVSSLVGSRVQAQAGVGPVIVVETSKGNFSFETYPNEAPKTVAHIVELVKRGFYDG